MRFIKLIFITITLFLFKTGYAKSSFNNIINDSIEHKENQYGVKVFLYLEDLYDVEIKNNYFQAKMWYELSTPKKHPTLVLSPDFKSVNDLVRINFWEESGVPQDISDSINSIYYHSLKGKFDHNWNVRNYPFDKPKLKIIFKAQTESVEKIYANENFEASFSEKIENLKDGFTVKSITTEKDSILSIEGSNPDYNQTLKRLIFNINLERKGAWLYLKLFLGSFLAFIISWLVFFIPKEEFGSRIDLSVGAIFGAVGNRAYVESIMPDVQVLTKADMVNNSVIFLIVFNIIIFMIQRNNKIQLDFFESNFNASVYTAYVFIVINSAILLW